MRDLKASDFEVYEDGVQQKRGVVRGLRPRPWRPAAATAPARSPLRAPPAPTAPGRARRRGGRHAEIRPPGDRLRLRPPSARRPQRRPQGGPDLPRQGPHRGRPGGRVRHRPGPAERPAVHHRQGADHGRPRAAAAQGNTAFSDNRQRTRDLLEASATARAGHSHAPAAAIPAARGRRRGHRRRRRGAAPDPAFANHAGRDAPQLRDPGARPAGLRLDQRPAGGGERASRACPAARPWSSSPKAWPSPPNVQAQFKSVIHNANRSNVSVYAMDAAGLRVASSTNEETRKEMLQAAERARAPVLESGADDVGGTHDARASSATRTCCGSTPRAASASSRTKRAAS